MTIFKAVSPRHLLLGSCLVASIQPSLSSAQLPEPQCQLSTVQTEILEAHNTARATGRYCGTTYYPATSALTWSCQLGRAASSHNQDMATYNFFSHTGSNGLQFWHRINQTGYAWSNAGENIAKGQSNTAYVMNSWLRSPGHCKNIMNKHFSEIGASSKQHPQNGIYWTTVLARPQ